MERTTIQPDDNACLKATGALSAGATNGTGIDIGPGFYKITIHVTAVSGTSPTLDLVFADSDAVGGSYTSRGAFPQISAVGVYEAYVKFVQAWVRYTGIVGGSSTPIVTCSIWAEPVLE